MVVYIFITINIRFSLKTNKQFTKKKEENYYIYTSKKVKLFKNE